MTGGCASTIFSSPASRRLSCSSPLPAWRAAEVRRQTPHCRPLRTPLEPPTTCCLNVPPTKDHVRCCTQCRTVIVPLGVEPGDFFQIQTPSGGMFQVTCPPGAAAVQQIQVAVPAQPDQRLAPEGPDFIASASFTGPKPGYAFKSGAQGMGYYPATQPHAVPAQMEREQAAEPGLYSVARMTGTWCNWLSCGCHPLWVHAFEPGSGLGSSFSTMGPGWCCLNWPCLGAHGASISECDRTYERTAGTNTFISGQHTAVLLGECKMTLDGRMYYWAGDCHGEGGGMAG